MTSILVRRRAVAALLLSLGSGCAPSDQIVVRFSSEPIRKAVNEMRLFAFGADPMSAREGSPPCSQIDPRGLGPGDAEARTGLTPQYRWRGANQTALGEFQSVRKGQYTVVVEGWGPPCKRVTLPARREDDPSCAEPSTTGQPVLRAYYCGIQTLDPRPQARRDRFARELRPDRVDDHLPGPGDRLRRGQSAPGRRWARVAQSDVRAAPR